jgi:hypothetical protein
MPEITWKSAPSSIIDVASKVIYDHHNDLVGASIGFILRSEEAHSQGRTVIGKACKPDKKLTPFLKNEYDFIIWITESAWMSFTLARMEALLDHLLSYCQYSESEGARLVGPDIQEFSEVLERRGLWNYNLQSNRIAFMKAIQQLPLPGFEISPRVEAMDPANIPADALK